MKSTRDVAVRAHISITDEEEKNLSTGFDKVLMILDELKSVDVAGIEAVTQVTGLENVMREDEIDTTRIFTQEQALANAPRKHNGYFVVDQVL